MKQADSKNKGVYILLMKLRNDTVIRIGALGMLDFRRGFYAYVGSAMGGLDQRLVRHLGKSKSLHWHVDYLLEKAEITSVSAKRTLSKREECSTARELLRLGGRPVRGFGSSDCRCGSHLLYIGHTTSEASVMPEGFKQYRIK